MSEMEYGNDILTLVDEDGTEHEFEVVDTMDIEDETYLALVPVLEEAEELLEDSGELVLLKSKMDGDEEFLEPIDNEEEFNRISAIFMERLEELYDFVSEDEDEE